VRVAARTAAGDVGRARERPVRMGVVGTAGERAAAAVVLGLGLGRVGSRVARHAHRLVVAERNPQHHCGKREFDQPKQQDQKP
jgi:hypothetical protein